MSQPCQECDGSTTWDDAVGSAICSSCGTLTDPSQSILTSCHGHLDQQYSSNFPQASRNSYRTGSSWSLKQSDKEARDKKNQFAIQEDLKSLSSSVGSPGLSPRAHNLFTQAMALAHHRWGRKARILAGACVSIALREVNKPESVHIISRLLQVAPAALSRTILSTLSLLNLALPPADPSMYVPTIQYRFDSILRSNQQDSGIPAPLFEFLQTMSLRSIANTACDLIGILPRLNSDVCAQSPSPTACAAFILAAEAEHRTTFAGLGDLAKLTGAICQVGKSVVMSRYKVIQDSITPWIRKLLWHKNYQHKKGRATKVSQRLAVIRALKDIIQFHQELTEAIVLPSFPQSDDSEASHDEADPRASPTPNAQRDSRPRKRRRTEDTCPLHDAAKFLLDPLRGSIPKLEHGAMDPSTSKTPLAGILDGSLILHEPLSRLQGLRVVRGGANPEQIADDELFDEGELETMLRSQEEVDQLRGVLGWISDDEDHDYSQEDQNSNSNDNLAPTRPRSGTKQIRADEPRQKSRINMEAYAAIMDEEEEYDDAFWAQDEKDFEDCDEARDHLLLHGPVHRDAEEVLESWRPVSPGAHTNFDAQDRYEQEYD
ncbi:hypothetical protein BDN72DRAFT_816391 [Pluteus cervinus]|uniref:Uncharacterized protein n=1 Tax=Pluteus cervinus TaxID=181527 RepID=A0ACD3B1P4_9AGAR|nr:hypothetical protein BDN72DRAFT_816391 [Pluteus cervinus]